MVGPFVFSRLTQVAQHRQLVRNQLPIRLRSILFSRDRLRARRDNDLVDRSKRLGIRLTADVALNLNGLSRCRNGLQILRPSCLDVDTRIDLLESRGPCRDGEATRCPTSRSRRHPTTPRRNAGPGDREALVESAKCLAELRHFVVNGTRRRRNAGHSSNDSQSADHHRLSRYDKSEVIKPQFFQQSHVTSLSRIEVRCRVSHVRQDFETIGILGVIVNIQVVQVWQPGSGQQISSPRHNRIACRSICQMP